MNIRLSRLIYGAATFIPGVYRRFSMSRLSVEEMALDGYSKWLHHLASAVGENAIPFPQVAAEIGPGPACPAGLAALVSGCRTYYALDVVEHVERDLLLPVFDEICRLFSRKADLRGWQAVMPGGPFPSRVIPDDRLAELLAPARLAALRGELSAREPNGALQMMIPWHRDALIREGSVDLVFSTAAMEHVDDLATACAAIHKWLRKDGLVSHVIDYGCHGAFNEWNGHWACPDAIWRILKGNRPYFINRQPHSVQRELLTAAGFRLYDDRRLERRSRLGRKDLSARFRELITDEDIRTNLCFLLARKGSA